jgi:CRISPR-associated protein Cas2
MLVVIANDLPPAVRGMIKLWFIEPRPNVFVSGIKDHVANKVIEYLYKNSRSDSGLIIFQSKSEVPNYKIITTGYTKKTLSEISGMQLVIEKSD